MAIFAAFAVMLLGDTTIYPDGLHPSGGYPIMADIAKPYIDAVVNGTAIPAVPAAAPPSP